MAIPALEILFKGRQAGDVLVGFEGGQSIALPVNSIPSNAVNKGLSVDAFDEVLGVTIHNDRVRAADRLRGGQ